MKEVAKKEAKKKLKVWNGIIDSIRIKKHFFVGWNYSNHSFTKIWLTVNHTNRSLTNSRTELLDCTSWDFRIIISLEPAY